MLRYIMIYSRFQWYIPVILWNHVWYFEMISTYGEMFIIYILIYHKWHIGHLHTWHIKCIKQSLVFSKHTYTYSHTCACKHAHTPQHELYKILVMFF